MGSKRTMALVLWLMLLAFLLPSHVRAEGGPVHVLVVEGMIDRGLAVYLAQSYQEAAEIGAAHVILEIDTPGGLLVEAIAIRDTIMNAPVPTAAFIKGDALSAGALLALAAETVIMVPGSTIGAAEPRLGTEKADEKTVSAWAAKLASTAEARGRNPELARAMADADVVIAGVVEKGKLLTLTEGQALEMGLADAVLRDRSEVLSYLGLSGNLSVAKPPGTWEQLARWATSPVAASLLLTIGFAGLLIEVFTLGFGVAGILGILSLTLYFGGHMLVGLTGWEAVFMFLLGLILLVIEVLIIPGFGLAGIGGVVALVVSVFLAAPTTQQAIGSLLSAVIGSSALLVLSLRFLPTRRVWQRLILGEREVSQQGYVAQRSLAGYLDKEGRALTPLRPAGTVELVDGSRLDVVTQGEFISRQARVRVVQVEGGRVVVRQERED